MAGIKFIDELMPNGSTFPIVDINNVKGGIHYADTVEQMNNIHSSRISPGILCYVKADKAYYTYDFTLNEWVKSEIGKDSKFVCTQNGVKSDEISSDNKLGNLPKMSREALEQLTINEILTRALFKEQPPYFTCSNVTVTTPSKEVGTTLAISDWTVKNGTYEYGYNSSGLSMKGTIILNNFTLDKTVAEWGVNLNAVAEAVKVTFNPTVSSPLDISYQYTSWGRTLSEYNMENTPTVAQPTNKAIDSFNIRYNGYYRIKWGYCDKTGKQISLKEDIDGVTNPMINITKEPTTNITGTVTINIGDDKNDSLENSAYVYFLIPTQLKISGASMRNGLTAKYDDCPASRINKVATKLSVPESTYQTKKMQGSTELYTYNLWYVAKGDENVSGQVTATKAALKITIDKAS